MMKGGLQAGSQTKSTWRLKRFHEAHGRTPECRACEGVPHRGHIAPCQAKQKAWEKTQPMEIEPKSGVKRPRDRQMDEEAAQDEQEAQGSLELLHPVFDQPLGFISGPPWYDEYTGELLDEIEVQAAMKVETDRWDHQGAVEEVTEMSADDVVVMTRWVIHRKLAVDGKYIIKARLVARQVNNGSVMYTYSALEALCQCIFCSCVRCVGVGQQWSGMRQRPFFTLIGQLMI